VGTNRLGRRWPRLILVILGIACFTPVVLAEAALPSLSELRVEAAAFEAKGQWAKAAKNYWHVMVADKSDAFARERYQLCLRHALQSRRLRDDAFRNDLLNRKLASALNVYEEILTKVQQFYVDEKRVTPAQLFEYGLIEFRFALEDPFFVEKYLHCHDADKIQAFADQLSRWLDRPIESIAEVRKLVQELTLNVIKEFSSTGGDKEQVADAVVVLEFAFGACNSLDEYSSCLTPQDYMLQSDKYVGVGIDLVLKDKRIFVSEVHAPSPAAGSINKGDQIVAIDGKTVDRLSIDVVAVKLRGKPGTSVELEIISGGELRTVKLERDGFLPHTVERVGMLDMMIGTPAKPVAPGLGYIKITGFNKNTPQEVKEAILQLAALKMQVLIIDLRDNGGGSFLMGAKTVEMFLNSGVIASTGPSRAKDFNNKTFKSQNSQAFDMPIVVLVNGETASAAELFAAALKENHRAQLVGRTTLGKNTMQALIPLERLSSGMRVTIARFYSPSKQDFGGRGIDPHEVVVLEEGATSEAQQLAELLRAATVGGNLIMMPMPGD
jgi:carboxyl-terminal processing protease